jgi:hypothetical protein
MKKSKGMSSSQSSSEMKKSKGKGMFVNNTDTIKTVLYIVSERFLKKYFQVFGVYWNSMTV